MSDVSKLDPMTCPLKVGDRVEVVGPSWRDFTGRIGEKAKIEHVGLNGYFAILTNPAARGYWFPRSSLRLVEPEPAKVAPAPEPQPAPNPSAAPNSSPSATGEEWTHSVTEINSATGFIGYSETGNDGIEIAAAHNASIARLAAAHRAEVERVRAEVRERCAKVVEPKRKRPCDCTSCDCGNVGSAQCVAEWDQAASIAAEIRAMK